MGCPPMMGNSHFHRGYSIRPKKSKLLINHGIISRPLQPREADAYGPHDPVDPHDDVRSAGDAVVNFGADHSTADARSCGRSGSVAPVTCGFAPAKRAPSPPRPIDAIQAPEYRPALRVGSAPKCRMLMLPVFPWRLGTPDEDVIGVST